MRYYNNMKIAFIHNTKKIGTGAHYINDLMSMKLKRLGIHVHNVYPKQNLLDHVPFHLKGLRNILFFSSLLEHKDDILNCDIIQGTTYTPLAFLPFSIPVVSHFGSTTQGFITATPRAEKVERATRGILHELKGAGVIEELNIKTRRPLYDVAAIEKYVAVRADRVIATSEIVKRELVKMKVPRERINVIHNAIEDYWFETPPRRIITKPKLIYLGRLGGDIFTLKLKAVDRMIYLFRYFSEVQKEIFSITTNRALKDWIEDEIPETKFFMNVKKDSLSRRLRGSAGSILIMPSRYEGFCLSLIEGMSQGLIPVSFPVGVAPEIIENGKNGFLVRDVYEARRRIQLILSDDTLRERLAWRARETAGNFRAQKMALQIKALYEEIMISKNGKRHARRVRY